jgi:ribose transport system permease protein
MKKLFGLMAFLVLLYAGLLWALSNNQRPTDDPQRDRERFLQTVNKTNYNLLRRVGFYGILSLGVGVLIIAGGIDLSIGSVVGLSATLLVVLLTGTPPSWLPQAWHFGPVSAWLAIPIVLLCGALIGLAHGLLVAKLRLQPFIVTLCSLFIFRGLARWLTGDAALGLEDRCQNLRLLLYREDVFGLPKFLIIFLVLAAVVAVVLHLSVLGRHLFAIGSNEKAARYSGIAVDRVRILAYMGCSILAAWVGCLYLMEHNAAQPTETGSFFELYAIAGAVLGGCSLRGGDGTVLGILVGVAIIWILPTLTTMWGVPATLEYFVTGAALLVGAVGDELLRRRVRPS